MQAQTHRRFLKAHLPVDALVFSPTAKYLDIGRDGRDIVWSPTTTPTPITSGTRPSTTRPVELDRPSLLPPADIRVYWQQWLEQDGYPFWPFWENVRSWWAIRSLPNVLFIHYANLKRDLPAQMRRIAAFLEIPIDEARWAAMLEHCSFD